MAKCLARLNYDNDKILVQETAKEMKYEDVFTLEFPINICRSVLKYSLRFQPLEGGNDDSEGSNEIFEKSVF